MRLNVVVWVLGLAFTCPPCINSQDIGYVAIGASINDTQEFYSFNINFGQPAFIIPFITYIRNETGDIIRNYTDDVEVTCELRISDTGYSTGMFTTTIVQAGEYPAEPLLNEISFSSPVAGRVNSFQCHGESVTSVNPQFTQLKSISDRKFFQIRAPGKVNIFSELTNVPNVPDGNSVNSQFLVELSEPATNTNVSVECFQDTPIPSGVMQLTFSSLVIGIGEYRGYMEYSLASKGSEVEVFCRGQSAGQPTDGQFLTSTSQGRSSVFIIAQGSFSLLPELTTLETTEKKVFLVLSELPTSTLTISCTLYQVNSTEEAREIANLPECDLPDYVARPTVPPGNSTDDDFLFSTNVPDSTEASPLPPTNSSSSRYSTWELRQEVFVFEANTDLFRIVELFRPSWPPQFTEELVVLKCCAPQDSNPLETKYTNQSATMLSAIYLSPPVAINWTAATPAEDLEKETEIINPAYIDMSPCSCDLTSEACDIGCCCDAVCTEQDKEMFPCIPGSYGGQPLPTPSYHCDSISTNREDWFPFMCVHKENSAFLGYYWFPESVLRSNTEYDTRTAAFQNQYSLRNQDPLNPEEPGSGTIGYKEGLAIKTGLPREVINTDYHIGYNYRLTLPARSSSGQCMWTAPVQFLADTDETCVWSMKEELCSEQSVLNALMYVQNQAWSGSLGPLILEKQGVKSIAVTDIGYYCINDTKRYLHSTERYEDVVEKNRVYLFGFDLPLNEFNETDCEFDSDNGAYVCGNRTVGGDLPSEEILPRCAWDDGVQRPPSPVFDNVTSLCENAVVDVLYSFKWSAQSVVQLEATIVLATLPLTVQRTETVTKTFLDTVNVVLPSGVSTTTTSIRKEQDTLNTDIPANFTQRFKVQFIHSMAGENSTGVIGENENSTVRARSGNPGYEPGLPIISGVVTFPNNSYIERIDSTDLSRLSLWKPGVDGLCLDASRMEINFRENTRSSCLLWLSFNEINDCENLKKLLLNRQDWLMPSSHISPVGDPDYENIDNWEEILREDVSYIIGENRSSVVEPVTDVTDATTEAHMSTTYSATTEFPESNFSYVDHLTGYCENVPSGIHLTILYAETGLSNRHPIYRVIGARISYTLTHWQMSCSGVSSCTDNNATRPFEVSSSVSFTQVPFEIPSPRTKFQIENEKDHPFCKQDVCWEELFYPFLDKNPGDDPQYTLTWGLLSLIFILALFMITRPLSRW